MRRAALLVPAVLILGVLAAGPQVASASCFDVTCVSDTLTATKGVPFSGQVGTSDKAPDYSFVGARIDWGDGSPEELMSLVDDGDHFNLIAPPHTYTSTGAKTIVVALAIDYFPTQDVRDHEASGTIAVGEDLTPPSLTVNDVVVDATSPQGAELTTFDQAAPTDPSGIKSFTCSPALPRTFPIGSSNASCTAIDNADNSVSRTFAVRVRSAAAQILRLDVLQGRALARATAALIAAGPAKRLACLPVRGLRTNANAADVQRIMTVLGCPALLIPAVPT